MQLLSPDFENSETLPARFTCDGEGINPSLIIEDIPTSAETVALIVDDPDAVSGLFTHWLVWNIDPRTGEIGQAEVPAEAVEGTNSAGSIGYQLPCPPSGTHRYFFKAFALDTSLTLGSDSDREQLEAEMDGHILDQAELIGTYSKG